MAGACSGSEPARACRRFGFRLGGRFGLRLGCVFYGLLRLGAVGLRGGLAGAAAPSGASAGSVSGSSGSSGVAAAASATSASKAALSISPEITLFDGPRTIVMLRPSRFGRCSMLATRLELLGEAVEDHLAALGVRDLTAAEHDRDLDLVLVQQEPRDMALLGRVVVLGDLRAELDLADRDLRLVLARGLLLLGLLVLVLRVVEDAADRRLGLGSDLDEIELPLLGERSASSVRMIPTCWPSSPITRTSGTRMRSLMRVVSRSGGRRSNLRGTGTRCSVRASRKTALDEDHGQRAEV